MLKNPHSLKYNNIFNIISYDDPVPLVAPYYWGMERYGITKVLPFREGSSDYLPYEKQMKQRLNKMKDKGLVENNSDRIDEFKNYDVTDVIAIAKGNNDSLGRFLRHTITSLAAVPKESNRLTYEKSLQNSMRSYFQTSGADGLEAFKRIGINLLVDNSSINFFGFDIINRIENHNTVKMLGVNASKIVTAVKNLDLLAAVHADPYYLAWMQSMDSYYEYKAEPYFSYGNYRAIQINCPVDIYVYDSSNQLVASIINEEPQEISGHSIISSIDENGQKVVYLPTDENYSVKTVAREDCETNIKIDEYTGVMSDVSKVIDYDQIKMKKKEEIVATATAYEKSIAEDETVETEIKEEIGANYTLEKSDKEIKPDIEIKKEEIEKYSYVVSTKYNENQGNVIGGGNFTIGDFCQVKAICNEGYDFEGWYTNGKKISNDSTYRFAVKNDITIEAKFKIIDIDITPYMFNSKYYADMNRDLKNAFGYDE